MNNAMMQQNGMARQGPPGANYNHFVSHYRSQAQQGKVPQGWQQSTQPEERGQLAFQFFTQFRILKPETPEIEAMRTSLQFENQVFIQSQSKDQYGFCSRGVCIPRYRWGACERWCRYRCE